MRLNQRFRRLVFAQVLLGIVAFGVAEPNPGLLLVSGALALLSWYVTEGPGGRAMPRWAINLGAIAAVAWLVVDLVHHHGQMVIAMGHFTMWLQILLLFGDKTNREYAQLLVLSLMTMIGASILSVSMLYGLLLVAYCGMGLVTLLHFHLKVTWDTVTDATRNAAPPERTVAPPAPVVGRGHQWHFRFLAMWIGFVCATVAVAVFVATPRSEDGPMTGGNMENKLTRKQPGFSERVQLGSSPSGEGQKEPVLNIQVTLHDAVVGEPMIFLLRGASLDRYDRDNRTWTRSYSATSHDRSYELPEQGLALAEIDPDETSYEATVTVRQSGLRVLFTVLPTTHIVSENIGSLTFNAVDQQLMAGQSGAGAMIYRIRWPLQTAEEVTPLATGGEPTHQGHRWEWGRRGRRSLADPVEEYARGWRVERERVAMMAQRILEPLGLTRDPQVLYDPRDERIAAALEAHLRNNFTYTLENPPTPANIDPVVDFLFNQRRGHCEVFAAAHAALCRSIGMQARVITGYHVSEFNRMAGQFVVRQSNAHAWTEVNCGPGRGWRTFDATPPADVRAEHHVDRNWLTSVREVYELIEYEWIRSIVAYDQKTRDLVMQEIQTSIGDARDRTSLMGTVVGWLQNLRELWKLDRLSYTLIFIILILITIAVASLVRTLMIRRKRLVALQLTALPRAQRRGLASRLRFYLTMLDMLERNGYVRPAWQSPFSFAQELAEANPMRFDPVVALTEIFYEIRFGHRQVDEDRRQRIRAHLKQLEQGLASR